MAAIGFAAISTPPRRAYALCAIIAAAGHSARFVLMADSATQMHIIPATLVASFIIGTLSVFLSPSIKTPAETCHFPALLPMVPGIYAYKSFGGLALCIMADSQQEFLRGFYLFAGNGLTCAIILLCMVAGATAPVFLFKKISFQATR